MEEKYLFEEKQYLGRDRTWITVRLILVLFCFVAYWLNLDQIAIRQIFFIVGVSVLIVSMLMLYVIHYKTLVTPSSIILKGLWTASLVKIDVNSIAKVEIKPYSRYIFNNPVYNLHRKNRIRFYTSGKNALHLTDNDGLVYVIGSQRVEEFLKAVETAKNES